MTTDGIHWVSQPGNDFDRFIELTPGWFVNPATIVSFQRAESKELGYDRVTIKIVESMQKTEVYVIDTKTMCTDFLAEFFSIKQ